MIRIMMRLIFLSLSLVALIGCSTSLSSLGPTYLLLEPNIKVYKDPDIDFSKYKAFSVFPIKMIDAESKLNSIEEKQVLFYIRNNLESLGYTFVEPNKNPDFMVTVNYDCSYQEYYVPPTMVTLPRYIPGEKITTYHDTSGSINTYGDINMYGRYSGSTTSTTYIPGKVVQETYTRPGYNVGHYYPNVAITIYEGKSLKQIWSATGAGTSNTSDFRVCGQRVIAKMLHDLRLNNYTNLDPQFLRGLAKFRNFGVSWHIITNNGNNFFPAIIITSNSPAEKAGLATDDIILEVNGEQTANKTFYEIGIIAGKSESPELNLKIYSTKSSSWDGKVFTEIKEIKFPK